MTKGSMPLLWYTHLFLFPILVINVGQHKVYSSHSVAEEHGVSVGS